MDVYYSHHNTYLHIANTCCTVDQTGNSVLDVGINEMDPAMENKYCVI